MPTEELAPNLIIEVLEERLKKMEVLYAKLRNKNNQNPQGHLRIHRKGKYLEYYQVTQAGDTCGNYISTKEKLLIRQLAQKDHDLKILSALEKEIVASRQYLNKISSQGISSFYKKMSPERRKLITPLTFSDELYAEAWQKISWKGRQFSEDAPDFYTSRGERVRSKSELLIANALFQNNIPYRYEFPLSLSRNSGNRITIYPDFLCLNKRTRSEFYWEHFGLIDSPDYSNNAAAKLRLYTENKIFPGKNLILTMETQSEPFSTLTLKSLIEAYLL